MFAALILAHGQTLLPEQAARANAVLAGGLYSIPLAALVRV